MIMPVFGTATMPTGTSVASPRGEEGFYQHFGTTTLNRSSSGAGSRAEGKEIGAVDVIMVKFATGFGTAILPACTSELSPRGERPADRSMTSHLPITYRSLTDH